MCELWCNFDSAVEAWRQRPLLVQRVRPLLQDERTKPAADQAQEKAGESFEHSKTVDLCSKNENIFAPFHLDE